MKKKRAKRSSLGMGLDSLLNATNVEFKKPAIENEISEDANSAEAEEEKQPEDQESVQAPSRSENKPKQILEQPSILDVIDAESESESKKETRENSDTSETKGVIEDKKIPQEKEEITEVSNQDKDFAGDEVAEESIVTEDSPDTQKVLDEDLAKLSEASRTRFEYLKFAVGNEIAGLDVQIIQEIIKRPSVTTIPESPDFVEGIFSLRSKVVPLINLGIYLGLYHNPLNENSMVIILHAGDIRIGLGVDRVFAINMISREEIKNPPSVLASRNSEIIQGIARIDDNAIMFLDPVTLFQKMEGSVKSILEK